MTAVLTFVLGVIVGAASQRAEPKIVTFGAASKGANRRNAARISSSAAAEILRLSRLVPSRPSPIPVSMILATNFFCHSTPQSSSKAEIRAFRCAASGTGSGAVSE